MDSFCSEWRIKKMSEQRIRWIRVSPVSWDRWISLTSTPSERLVLLWCIMCIINFPVNFNRFSSLCLGPTTCGHFAFHIPFRFTSNRPPPPSGGIALSISDSPGSGPLAKSPFPELSVDFCDSIMALKACPYFGRHRWWMSAVSTEMKPSFSSTWNKFLTIVNVYCTWFHLIGSWFVLNSKVPENLDLDMYLPRFVQAPVLQRAFLWMVARRIGPSMHLVD